MHLDMDPEAKYLLNVSRHSLDIIHVFGHCVAIWSASCKANGDRNQLGAGLDSDLISE